MPKEPVEIGTTPQFFVDDYLVDNRWAVRYENASKEMVLRVFHPPKKYSGNPVLVPYKPSDPLKPRPGAGSVNVLRDPVTGQFRMWYQSSTPKVEERRPGEGVYRSVVSYAESKDGINWTLPKLNVVDAAVGAEPNAVWAGATGRGSSAPVILSLPPSAMRGYRYVMLHLDGGVKLVGSHDGIRWDRDSVTQLASMHSDTANSIVYDAERREYVMYCRAKHIYRVGRGDIIETGESRRVARMASPELWKRWESSPQNILQADEADTAVSFTAFYGMTAQIYGGIYWGFLQPFKWNSDVVSQLAFSRDGVDFDRLADRTPLIALGDMGSWDSGMVFAASSWVDMGKEWWLYYSGWDGPHSSPEQASGRWRTGNVGLAKGRKEGFISMRGPENGGVIVTRKLRWPGGRLQVNADSRLGELKVRVSDERRKVIAGFDYGDGAAFTGDEVAHEIAWNGKSLHALKGQIVRLEFFLKKADLFSFRATGDDSGRK